MADNTYFPLRGKTTLAELRRACHANPAFLLTESLSTIEAMLWSMEPDRKSVLRMLKKGERDPITVLELARYYADVFGSLEEFLIANQTRNLHIHSGDRTATPPTQSEMKTAAEHAIRFIEIALPHLPAAAREYLLSDPHIAPTVLSLEDARGLDSPWLRFAALAGCLEQLLAKIDRENNLPPYDLLPQRQRAAIWQRCERHRSLLPKSVQVAVAEAMNLFREHEAENMSSGKERYLAKKLQRCEQAIETAIAALRQRLGLPEIASAPDAGEDAIPVTAPPAASGASSLAEERLVEPALIVQPHEPAPPRRASTPEPVTTAAAYSPGPASLPSLPPPAAAAEKAAPPPVQPRLPSVTVRVVIPRSTLRWLSKSAIVAALGGALLAGTTLSSKTVAATVAAPPVGQVFVAPNKSATVLHWARPSSTLAAETAAAKGVVILRVRTDANGMPDRITVVGSIGYGLDQTALAAVSRWRFAEKRTTFLVRVPFGEEAN